MPNLIKLKIFLNSLGLLFQPPRRHLGFLQPQANKNLFLFSGSCEKGNWFHIIFFTSLLLPPLLRDPVRSKQKTSLLWTAYNSRSLLGYGKVCQCRKLEFRVLSEAYPIEASSVNHIWQPFVKGLSQLMLRHSVLVGVDNLPSPTPPPHLLPLHPTHRDWNPWWFLHVKIFFFFSWCWLALTDLILD